MSAAQAIEREEPGHFEHRLISAHGAPSVLPRDPVVSPFVSWRRDGSATAPTEEPAADTHAEQTMPKPTRQANATSIRMRVCRALAGSDMHREALAALLSDLTTKQLTQNVFMLKADKLVEYYSGEDGTRMYRLTVKGRRYVESPHDGSIAGSPFDVVKKARATAAKVPTNRAKPGAKVRRRAAQTAEIAAPAAALAVRAFEPVVERSFRCAVFSDGSFVLAKAGQEIALTKPELSEALRYLERMAEQSA